MSPRTGAARGERPRGALRPLEEQDLELVLSWRNHPEVRRWMYTSHEIGLEEHRRWFKGAAVDASRFLLVYELQGIPSGYVNLTMEEERPGSATWGFYLAPDAPLGSGRGLGQAALEFAFESVGVEVLRGEALASNLNSIAFHRRLGFSDAGQLEAHHRSPDGATHDVASFTLERAAWASARDSRSDLK